MTYREVQSSQIHSIAHDPATQTLGIKFKGNKKNPEPSEYHYSDFPAAKFAEFEKAESFGKHFGANIKGKYPHKKITP